jgi:hypothetical protein
MPAGGFSFMGTIGAEILRNCTGERRKEKNNKNNSDCAPSTCQGKFKPASYADCMALGAKRSWDPNTAWLYCSNQGYKN